MKNINNKSGFTLIEIIVVLIIIGVLACIAMPNLFTNIQKSKGAEAVASFGAMKASVEACGMKHPQNGYGGCLLDASQVGVVGNFTYCFNDNTGDAYACKNGGNGGAWNTSYSIVAFGLAANNFTPANDYIVYSVTSFGGTGTCTGYGAFSGVC